MSTIYKLMQSFACHNETKQKQKKTQNSTCNMLLIRYAVKKPIKKK